MDVSQQDIEAARTRVRKLAASLSSDMRGAWVGLMAKKMNDMDFLRQLAKVHLDLEDDDAAFKAGLEEIGLPATGVQGKDIFDIIGKGRVKPSLPLGAKRLRELQNQAGEVPTILNARPATDAAPPIPLPLVHPSFGKFLDSMEHMRDVTIADMSVFLEWCAASADFYDKQGDKHDAMMPVLQKLFGDLEDGNEDDDCLHVVSGSGLTGLGGCPDFIVRRQGQVPC